MKTNKVPRRIRRAFPQVKEARDATETIEVSVLPKDASQGRKKDPASCALARACVRQNIADAAIIGVGFSWLIKGKVATRYKTSVGVGREITSFDRHQDFAEGTDYKLQRVPPSNRLTRKQDKKKKPSGTHPKPLAIHHTANIRITK